MLAALSLLTENTARAESTALDVQNAVLASRCMVCEMSGVGQSPVRCIGAGFELDDPLLAALLALQQKHCRTADFVHAQVM